MVARTPRSAVRRRATIIGLYWLVQAAVYFFGWPLLLVGGFEDPSDTWRLMVSPEYLWQAGVWLPSVMILQAAQTFH